MNPTVGEIIGAIEEAFPPCWQEDFDNTGWQVLLPGADQSECQGMLICVDATVDIVEEARRRGCNLILTHHPLLFRAIKRITGSNRVELSLIEAIRAGISIYSCHTSVDSAPDGVSHVLASKLGLSHVEILSESSREGVGIGVVGDLPLPLTFNELVARVKEAMHSPVARCSGLENVTDRITKIAIGGGACADLIPLAVSKGARVMITADVKHNYFIDYDHVVAVIDLGHYETEECTKEIFYNVVRKKFPNFVPYYSEIEKNPIIYL